MFSPETKLAHGIRSWVSLSGLFRDGGRCKGHGADRHGFNFLLASATGGPLLRQLRHGA